jgi:PTH1 family peptidyl-tRNA hydrolase
MAWLQKRPHVSDPVNFVKVGLNKTILAVGLGNPGKEYDGTRHNIGFACLDYFVEKNPDMQTWIAKTDMKCRLSSGQLGETRVVAIKPTTFMNLSGEAVQKAANFYKIPASQIIVVHDEIDIDFGHIRTRQGGAAAGHNGVKSVIGQFGEDFGRVRVGIGPKTPEQIDSADFVLQKFNKDEQAHAPELCREVNSILTEYVYGGQLPADTRNFLI